VPLVQVNLLILTGSADDPAGKFGIASLTAAMLDEGAGQRTALQIADDIEFLGAALETSSSFDASAVRLNVPSARLEAALPLMADVALRPTFPQAELERLRQERLTTLIQARDDAAQVAPLAFSRVVFGGMHRYGTAAMGTPSTLKAFTTMDLRAFHSAMYQPSSATLVVAGDVRADTLLPLLEKQFGGWKAAGAATRTQVSQSPQLTERQVTIIDMPGAEQSQVRIGWVGVPRSTPDYFTLQVLNTILGGSFTSRLNQNLREKHQFTYGASSRFDMRLAPGPFFAGAGIQTDKTSDALREFFTELNAIGSPVNAEELTKAKNYLALGFPSEFETIEDLASHIEEMVVYKLPDNYFGRYVANIQAVTVDAVQKAAATYIQPGKFAVVIAGDRKAIEAGVRGLKLGQVRVLSVGEGIGS
jgi:predicted Zn-dependent peptidase